LPIGTNPLASSSDTVAPDGSTPQVVASGAWVFPTPGVDAHDQLPELVLPGAAAVARSSVALECTSPCMGRTTGYFDAYIFGRLGA
jgi:hypothetical protein